MTAHIESRKEDIADIVLMPGDSLRAKYIAEEFLDDYKLVNTVRNIYGYTGYYKGVKITVFASGMGIPSIGIYAYELYKFYDVKTIIRIGTCGTIHPSVKLLDVVLATSAFSFSTFPLLFDGDLEKEYSSSDELNKKITKKALEMGINDQEKFISNFPKEEFLASEMEAFCLFYLAHKLNKEAACILTVVDSKYDKRSLSSEDRQTSLNEMIKLAIEASINKN